MRFIFIILLFLKCSPVKKVQTAHLLYCSKSGMALYGYDSTHITHGFLFQLYDIDFISESDYNRKMDWGPDSCSPCRPFKIDSIK